VVDVPEASALIQSQFPELAPTEVVPFGEGFDNTAYLVNRQWVFRFPRRAFAVPLLAVEIRLLPLIASQVPLPVPTPVFSGHPTGSYPWPFYGYHLMAGTTACRANLASDQRHHLAGPLGRFLAALHAIPLAEAAAHGAGPDTIRRLDVPFRLQKAETTLTTLVEKGVITDPGPIRHALHTLADPLPGPRPQVLVHGDLYARHLLVDDHGDLSGIIDWGDTHLGDPALDIAIAPYFLPPDAWTTFRYAYGPISDETWRLARFRALVHALLVQVFATAIGDADLLREAQIGPLQVLQNCA
jgi:aminoglycoside phosphotransferase (APT) family kinase protein